MSMIYFSVTGSRVKVSKPYKNMAVKHAHSDEYPYSGVTVLIYHDTQVFTRRNLFDAVTFNYYYIFMCFREDYYLSFTDVHE